MGLWGARTTKTPIGQHLKFTDSNNPLLDDFSSYHRLVGRLICLTVTQSDIIYSIHILSQFMQNSKQPHYDAAIGVLCYSKSSPSEGLLLSSSSDVPLCAYVDLDCVTCPMTKQSTAGYFTLLGSSSIS